MIVYVERRRLTTSATSVLAITRRLGGYPLHMGFLRTSRNMMNQILEKSSQTVHLKIFEGTKGIKGDKDII